jgi:hypothetical protein
MNGTGSSLAELFPDGDYRFHLTLRRAEPRDFFAPRDDSGRVLAERRRWLESDPERYALRRALASMPPELVAYKRIERVREAVINMLG